MKILVIQTAFIGDAILATAVLEALHKQMPHSQIYFMVRAGNEQLFYNHPYIEKLIVWEKRRNKLGNLIQIAKQVRQLKFDVIVNLHRFASSGFICLVSGAKSIRGFDKNPFSFCYNKKCAHDLYSGLHETQRNHLLINDMVRAEASVPKLYPDAQTISSVAYLKQESYVCMAPASVWFTKQLPQYKWVELIDKIPSVTKIYLLGADADQKLCDEIISSCNRDNVHTIAGKLSLLQSAVLMQGAQMNYVNDSAPLHLCSAMNAPVTAFFCSTTPGFGFGPLSSISKTIEATPLPLCKPCGIHGFKACPQQHFKCAIDINILP